MTPSPKAAPHAASSPAVPPCLFASPLLAGANVLDQPAVLGSDRTWTWRELHAASLDLAQRLGDADAVANLCGSRAGFLVAFLATLRGARLTVLPPSGGHADLVDVLKTCLRPVVVVDAAEDLRDSWREHARCLSWRRTPAPATSPPPVPADLAWQPDWHRAAVLLFTSGSTGAPESQVKSLLHLAQGALVLGERLSCDVVGGVAALRQIVCSVAPQHMFGLEASVMLSLVHGIPVREGRPLLPADVQQAFASARAAAWVATPLHLRSLAQSSLALSNCSVVIVSTMPLPQALAQRTEALVGAPVLEIYGSTETGVLAMRRGASDPRWWPVSGVQVAPFESAVDGDGVGLGGHEGGAGATASGSHFSSPVTLLDRIELAPDGSFKLLGRHADVIKIAGRRSSLAGLNLLLQDLPGLSDGVFYLPASDNPTERLCLIHAGPALDRAATERWLRARLDPVFLPRSLIPVAKLPRNDNGKLPRAALDEVYRQWQHAMVAQLPEDGEGDREGDRESDRESDRKRDPQGDAAPTPREFEFMVPHDHPALPGHFPGRPMVPGVLLLDHVLSQIARGFEREVTVLQQVKFVAPLLPGELAMLSIDSVGERFKFSVRVRRAGATLTLATGVVSAAEAPSR